MAGNRIYDAGQVSDAIFIIEMATVDIIPQGKQIPFATPTAIIRSGVTRKRK